MKDPDQNRCSNATHKAKKRGIKGAFTPQQWRLACTVYGGGLRCLCCQATDRPLTVDHVIPLVKGGRNSISNVQPLCWECNTRKADRVIDFRPLDKILLLRRMLKECAAQAAEAKAARRERIVQIIAWACFSSPAHYRRFIMARTTTAQAAVGSTVPRYDTPITTLEQMAAELERVNVPYDDNSLAAWLESVGNTPGYVLQIHASRDALAQLKSMLSMGALCLGWEDSAPIVEYVERQLVAACPDFADDVPEVELMERAWIYMAEGMGPIDAHWQAVYDWEDENLRTSDEKAALRATLRERSAQARERYNTGNKTRIVEQITAREAAQRAAGQPEGSAADE